MKRKLTIKAQPLRLRIPTRAQPLLSPPSGSREKACPQQPLPTRVAGGRGFKKAGRCAASRRRAFSLLEIVLALAIMGVAMAALSGIISNGASAAIESRDLAWAQMLAESKMAEALLNPDGPQAASEVPLEATDTLRGWTYTIFTQPAPVAADMLEVKVTVQSVPEDGVSTPVQFSLTQWIVDPALDLQGLEDEAAALAEEEAAAEEESF